MVTIYKKSWVGTIIAASLMVGLASSGCSMAADRSTIRVAIGMTPDELVKGSSYPLESAGETVKDNTGAAFPAQWMIAKPYSLIYMYKGRELRRSDIGGDNYFIAITTGTGLDRNIISISITDQNRPLTLDEAVTEAKALNDWFVAAGFGQPTPDSTDANRFGPPFQISEQDRAGTPYSAKLTSYEDVRAAFLDDRAKIVSISPFDLAGDNVSAGLTITNAHRGRENTRGGSTPLDPPTERTYFLNLTISSRSYP